MIKEAKWMEAKDIIKLVRKRGKVDHRREEKENDDISNEDARDINHI